MNRMLGLRKREIILELLIQTAVFVTPGLIFAYILSFPALHYIFFYAFENTLGLKLEATPTTAAILNAIFVGIFIPAVSSILPIREALQKNLNEALDYTRSKTRA